MAQSGKHGDRRKLEGRPEGLGHNPFSGLAGGTKGASGSVNDTPSGTPGGDSVPSGQPSGHPEVLVQRERKGRGGKGVIMVLGLKRPGGVAIHHGFIVDIRALYSILECRNYSPPPTLPPLERLANDDAETEFKLVSTPSGHRAGVDCWASTRHGIRSKKEQGQRKPCRSHARHPSCDVSPRPDTIWHNHSWPALRTTGQGRRRQHYRPRRHGLLPDLSREPRAESRTRNIHAPRAIPSGLEIQAWRVGLPELSRLDQLRPSSPSKRGCGRVLERDDTLRAVPLQTPRRLRTRSTRRNERALGPRTWSPYTQALRRLPRPPLASIP